jgi:hypothetical protein
MNRREAILGISIVPIIPYINIKYKTPYGYEPYEKFTLTDWEEYPFEEIQPGDIVRRKRFPEDQFKVIKLYPRVPGFNDIPGFTVDIGNWV